MNIQPGNYNQHQSSSRLTTGTPYMLPDTHEDINRLDLPHYLLRYVLKGNYLAPIAEPARILDVASGTGLWLAEMAQEFPQAELFGIDFTIPEQTPSLFPANCHFQVGNVLNELPFDTGSLDFVHQRLLLFAIPLLRWQPLVDKLTQLTRQGGWIELVEVNPFFHNAGPSTQRIINLVAQATRQRGLDPAISLRLHTLLTTAGLKRVGTSTQLIPLGNWGGQPGALAATDVQAIVQAMKPLVLLETQTASEEYDALAIQMPQEFEEYQTTFTFHIAYGQRQ